MAAITNIHLTPNIFQPSVKVDFGNIYLQTEIMESRLVEFSNSCDDDISIHFTNSLYQEIIPNTTLGIKFLAWSGDSNSLHMRGLSSDMPQQDIIVSKHSTIQAMLIISGHWYGYSFDQQQHMGQPRAPVIGFGDTGMATAVSPTVNILCSTVLDKVGSLEQEHEPPPSWKFGLSICSFLCQSVMAIDEDDINIDFDNCLLGATYVRDFNIWNKSESELFFRIVPLVLSSSSSSSSSASTNTHHNKISSPYVNPKYPLVFMENDSGVVLKCNSHTYAVPSCASKRIRISFKAEVSPHIFSSHVD